MVKSFPRRIVMTGLVILLGLLLVGWWRGSLLEQSGPTPPVVVLPYPTPEPHP